MKNLAAVLATGVCMVAMASPAQAQNQEYQIPAGSLKTVLDSFAKQSGRQVIYRTDEVRGTDSPGAVGTMSADAALDRILTGTGFVVRRDSSGALAIVRANSGAASSAAREAGTASSFGDGTSSSGEDIVITGTRIAGVAPVGSPLQSYSRADIEKSGATTLADFARQLPSNYASADPTNQGQSASGLDQSGGIQNGGSAFNLRGLGPAATLTLVNGMRIAPGNQDGNVVDISLIPLSAIEHVEILTDGASAIYGADAISGVVNIILRKRFEGFETTALGTITTRGGGEKLQSSQAAGTEWSSGSGFLVYDYSRAFGLKADERSFIPSFGGPQTVLPSQATHSVFGSVFQDVSPSVRLSSTGHYVHKSTDSESTNFGRTSTQSGESEFYGLSANLEADVVANVTAKISGATSNLRADTTNNSPFGVSGSKTEAGADDVIAQLTGSAFDTPAGEVRFAVGGEYQGNTLSSNTVFSTLDGVTIVDETNRYDRSVWSLFGELLVPLIPAPGGKYGESLLVLSTAVRYDHYSDFGSTVNPRIGVAVMPADPLTLRASYNTSFRAPALSQLSTTRGYSTFLVPNPASPSGTSDLLYDGSPGNPDLKPETSRSFSAGFDFHPLSGLTASMTYSDIRYKDRISLPPVVGSFFDVYSQLDTLAPFINLSPTPEQIDGYFSTGLVQDFAGLGAAGVEGILDGRPANLAASHQRSLEGAIQYVRLTDMGQFDVSLNGVYLIENSYKAASTTPAVRLINDIGAPLRYRVRGSFGWSKAGWSASLFANFYGRYQNSLATPDQRVPSWTTFDLNIGYASEDVPIVQNLSASLSVQNILNSPPPFIRFDEPLPPGFGFDSANANGLGRVISLRLRTRW
jgi:iron complex outermembrane receptor protein